MVGKGVRKSGARDTNIVICFNQFIINHTFYLFASVLYLNKSVRAVGA